MRGTVHGYLSVTPTVREVALTRNDIRYALLPVWFMTTRYKDKTYAFAINGQTGKMSGKLPVSRGKFAAFFSAITALVGGLTALALFL